MDHSTVVENVPASGSSIPRLMDIKVGAMPLPVYLVVACIVIGASIVGKLPADMIGGFAIIMVFGFLLGHVGAKIPVLKTIGGAAILSLFVPSALLAYGLFNPSMKAATVAIMKTSNFLYLYISCLVAGSLLGMNRKVLIQGFMRMFIPLLVGTIAASVVGIGVGLLFGFSPYKTFFFVLIPIMGGGIGEGILPLSMAYAEILVKPQGELIAMMIPAALIGNVVAIIAAGLIKRIGDNHKQYNGNGLLVRTGEDNDLLKEMNTEKPFDLPLMGCGLLIACSFWIMGSFLAPVLHIPGPILMILGAALAKVTRIVPARMEQGASQMYKFMTTNMTYPLLVGLGILYVPWKDLISAFTIGYFFICASAVLAMISSGWFIGKFLNMYQVESALVTACHSGLGGTGDVAILSACDRMGLMPFAQISTRIGGASMVVLAVFAIKMFI
ncbi:MAG: 2-hydroxycarboxylate transporter family protein [Formivibrio sp.]|nr:2-hydroxycarboxylate transporter family protein [Formivibrio sp.]